MPKKWEYARLFVAQDPGLEEQTWPAWEQLPGDTEWREFDRNKLFEKLNELGSDGWELVGPPTSQNSVFTYKAGNDTWHDRAYWVELNYLFKREATA